jgi:NAD(P)-dependent dehydrogenase (short-subunit alcohol dehydrogenase family)
MDLEIEGRVAVVTGAASGIGRATARRLAREGCHVVAVDLEAITIDSDELGESAIAVEADISDPDCVRRIFSTTVTAFGRLDILVCSAGVFETTGPLDLSADEWDRIHSVNLRGAFLCAQAAAPVMSRTSWGRIVLLSSMAAQTGGLAAGAAYVSAKAGVMGLTRSLAIHFGHLGITVNCVNPGTIETPMTAYVEREALAARTPLRRNGTPEEVADMIAVLSSERSSFVTGAHLSINGGLVAD